jgi:hypothetical protein
MRVNINVCSAPEQRARQAGRAGHHHCAALEAAGPRVQLVVGQERVARCQRYKPALRQLAAGRTPRTSRVATRRWQRELILWRQAHN